jgi:drug/metabolite transporter (DMT)-like permease
LVTGLAAVAVVVAGDLEGGGHVLGYLLVAGGMLALSAGTLLERRWALPTAPFDQLTIHCLTSCVVFVAVAAATGRLSPPMTPGFWWAVVWVVVLSTFGGYGCYLLTLRSLGATGASTLLFLTPPTTMVWALLMFGDPISWTTVVGLAGCAAAVWLVLARRRTAPSGATERLPVGRCDAGVGRR